MNEKIVEINKSFAIIDIKGNFLKINNEFGKEYGFHTVSDFLCEFRNFFSCSKSFKTKKKKFFVPKFQNEKNTSREFFLKIIKNLNSSENSIEFFTWKFKTISNEIKEKVFCASHCKVFNQKAIQLFIIENSKKKFGEEEKKNFFNENERFLKNINV